MLLLPVNSTTMHCMNKLLFGGTASSILTQKIAQLNNLELGKHEVVRFGNSEVKVTIQSDVNEKECIVVQSTANPTDEHVMELLFTVDALKREGASKVECIIPYFGYARQNIQHRKGECVSMNIIVKMLESLKVDKVTVVDLHEEGSSGMFTIQFENRTALPLLAQAVKEQLSISDSSEGEYRIGSPDQGGIERARRFAEAFYHVTTGYELITTEKKRNLENMHESKAVELYGDVKGKKVILVDDVATSGGTIIHAAELCLEKGATTVFAVVVHADFALLAPQKVQESKLEKLFLTNTIEKTLENLSHFPKIEIIDITSLFTL